MDINEVIAVFRADADILVETALEAVRVGYMNEADVENSIHRATTGLLDERDALNWRLPFRYGLSWVDGEIEGGPRCDVEEL